MSVIIPAYNEGERVAATVAALSERLERGWPRSHEIIVVDDGSDDDTLEAAMASSADRACRVVSYPTNRGKGYALKRGFAGCRGSCVAFMDADGEIAADHVVALLQEAERGTGVVVGRRRWHSSRPVFRRLGSLLLTTVGRFVFRLPAVESQSGAKAFVRATVADLVPACRENGFLFDLELLVLANRRRVTMTMLDVTTTVLRPPRIGAAAGVRELLRIARLWWRLGDGEPRHTLRTARPRPVAARGVEDAAI